jgi:hypothetical protein
MQPAVITRSLVNVITCHVGSAAAAATAAAFPQTECTTVQVVPGGNDTTLRTRVTCKLGANFTWEAGGRAHITIPVVTSSAAQGNLINVATAKDNLNRTATDSHVTLVDTAPVVRNIEARMQLLHSLLLDLFQFATATVPAGYAGSCT